MIKPLVAHTFEISSIVTSVISELSPMPPYSLSYITPKISFSRNTSTTSHGNSAVLSISAARGAIFSRAIVRTNSRISRCSSLRGSRALMRRSLDLGEWLVHDVARGDPTVQLKEQAIRFSGVVRGARWPTVCRGDSLVERAM